MRLKGAVTFFVELLGIRGCIVCLLHENNRLHARGCRLRGE
jgi:hypothetical protein